MNDGDRIYMTELLAQLKMVNDQQMEAKTEINKWIDRMGLAQKSGNTDLFEAARQRAKVARDKARHYESVIMELEVERDNLKREVRENRRSDPAIARTQALLKSLEGTVMDPTEATFDRLARQSKATSDLDELKQKMGMD
mgnify:CR=1 FL=1